MSRVTTDKQVAMPTGASDRPIVVLGAGINGAAIARELVLSGRSVIVVEKADIACGTTAYSSRLIHGGLRYLEYGEFDLVRESLDERRRLLELAPQFVRPLKLHIPVRDRFGGALSSARQFFGLGSPPGKSRGLWLVRAGLWLYDRYARDPSVPKSQVHRSGREQLPPVDADRFPWLCSYWDAQLCYPERFTVSLLTDAAMAARERSVSFACHTYHRARLRGDVVELFAEDLKSEEPHDPQPAATIRPQAIINATGAWVDETLDRLQVDHRRLIGGTKGSHLLTYHRGLAERLGGHGIYAEAEDGRPVFLLPYLDGALIGTTDIRFDGDPAAAVAEDEEVDYLLGVVREVFSDVRLTRDDLHLTYCGVRPLPHVDTSSPAGITRRHAIERNESAPLPLYSIVGGKLTTCRSLAEEVCRRVLGDLELPSEGDSRERFLPGGEGFDPHVSEPSAAVRRCRQLFGAASQRVLDEAQRIEPLGQHAGSVLETAGVPRGLVRWVLRNEWAHRLGDLVERRLMLLYDPQLSHEMLRELAEILAEEGHMRSDQVHGEVRQHMDRLQRHFRLRIKARSVSEGPTQ